MLKTTEEERIRQFEATKDDIEALDDDELDGGAGGVYHYRTVPGSNYHVIEVDGCRYDFTDDDCWWEDACVVAHVIYDDCTAEYYPG